MNGWKLQEKFNIMNYVTKLNNYLKKQDYVLKSITKHQYNGKIDDLEASAKQLYLALKKFDKDVKLGNITPNNGEVL